MLKPCPFCGSALIDCHNRYDGWVVKCQSCQATMPHLVNHAHAVETWNERPQVVTPAWLNHHLKVK